MRPIDVDESDDVPALPAWAEAELAERREFWATLRDGGAVTPEDEAEAIGGERSGH